MSDVDGDDLVTQIEPSIFHVKAIMPIEFLMSVLLPVLSGRVRYDRWNCASSFGHMPERGDQVQVADVNFEVLNATPSGRLLRVNISA